MQTASLTLRIDSRLADVFLVGLSIRGMCQALPLDPTAIDAVEICVVEAVNNAIEHAYANAPGHAVEVEVLVDDAALQMAVRDQGRAMDWPATCARADASDIDPLADGGRGVFIIRSLMDDVSYARRDGWNVLTMIKFAPPPLAAVAPGRVA
jgi:serine/threonine-protein kinase RsbW